MRICFHKTARKQLLKLQDHQQKQVWQKLRQLQEEGLAAPLDIKRLRGRMQRYRLRVGQIRVIFRQEGDMFIIMVIGPRGDVYKS